MAREYNYATTSMPIAELPGISVFYKDPTAGHVLHTHSTYARGLDMLNVAYHYLDIVPKGPDEEGGGSRWLRRRDEYDDAKASRVTENFTQSKLMHKEPIMDTAKIANHSAIRVRRPERDRIRTSYRDVLGAKIIREFDDKDDIRLGDGLHVAFLYRSGDGREADKSVTRKKIVAFGIKVLKVPDPHLYFQAPGVQVWRLVGSNEDLSKYEGNGGQ